MRHRFKKHRKKIWAYIIGASLIFLGFLAILIFRASQIGFIYPNVHIGDINFGKMTQQEAYKILNEKKQSLFEKGITLKIKGEETNLALLQYAQDPDLSRDLIEVDTRQTANSLYKIGRHPYNPFSNIKNVLQILIGKKEIKADVSLIDDNLLAFLKENLEKYETPAKNAKISYENDNVKILHEIAGSKINYENILKTLEAQLELLQNPYITVDFIRDEPTIKFYEVEDRKKEVEQALARAPFFIKFKDKQWEITRDDLKEYLDFERQDGVAVLAISENKASALFDEIAKEADMPRRDAKFTIENGKVVEFQTSHLGLKFNKDKTRDSLNSILLNGFPAVNAIIEADMPEVTTASTNDLGISELIGVGESNFYGSPNNRIHNIKTGAEILNGLLIKPGQTFSLIEALGKIDGEHGFKQELVIKEGRTIPEFGGGLCQIGTTAFRGAIDSGLPIIERKNHSYRVSYYEPAGTDATIYNPAPDLKFKNDTPNHILLLTKTEGYDLIFEFWGTKDGRTVSYTKPVIYNITNPPAPKYITTDELAPGKKKKIETAHKGADAYFEYNVSYPDERGEIKQKIYSHYRPWAEVWLIGATSTPEITSDI